jgi:hypothetical protein
MPVAGQEVGIGRAQGALQQAVAHRAAVDEQVLVGGVAAVVGGQADEARQAHAIAGLVDLQGVVVEVAAQHGRQAGEAPLRAGVLGRQADDAAAVDVQGEADALVGHGLALDLLGDRQGLGALGLHELQARGGGVEQVAHLDPRPVVAGEGGGGYVADGAALDQDRPGVAGALGARGDRQAGHRADRGQGLAPEAHGVDAQQVPQAVLVGGQLGGGVALDGHRQLVGGQAAAVVGHQDAGQAAAVGLDLDPRGAGVDGVVDQLLDGAGRPLDHLAGGDAVDGLGRKAADRHGQGASKPPS